MRKILAVLVVLVWMLGMWYLWGNWDGVCVRAYPQTYVVGRINRFYFGMDVSGFWGYTLSYPGVYGYSGGDCWCELRVTELEYNRLFDNPTARYSRLVIGDKN